jgi:hypothetical protein
MSRRLQKECISICFGYFGLQASIGVMVLLLVVYRVLATALSTFEKAGMRWDEW